LSVEDIGAAYVVKDNSGQKLAYVVMKKSQDAVRRRSHYLTANASLATFGILCTPAIPAQRLTIGIERYRWLPNPSFVKSDSRDHVAWFPRRTNGGKDRAPDRCLVGLWNLD
jgi:hypothetical protein